MYIHTIRTTVKKTSFGKVYEMKLDACKNGKLVFLIRLMWVINTLNGFKMSHLRPRKSNKLMYVCTYVQIPMYYQTRTEQYHSLGRVTNFQVMQHSK
jgi:hypothetical protein